MADYVESGGFGIPGESEGVEIFGVGEIEEIELAESRRCGGVCEQLDGAVGDSGGGFECSLVVVVSL